MEATGSSETSTFIRPTRRHIQEDDSLHSHSRRNLESYKAKIVHRRTEAILCNEEGFCNPMLKDFPLHVKVIYQFLMQRSQAVRSNGHSAVCFSLPMRRDVVSGWSIVKAPPALTTSPFPGHTNRSNKAIRHSAQWTVFAVPRRETPTTVRPR
jgi:hypothetical protein